MSAEENKALVRDLFAGADAAREEVLDEVLAGDYDDHNPPPFQGPTTGLAGAHEAWQYATNAFSDWSHEVLAQHTDGDFVITRVVGRATHTGDFLGVPATGREVTMEGIAIHRVVDGKLVEHWGQVDAIGLMMQMGAIPAPA
jgi:predicted ester cyclase